MSDVALPRVQQFLQTRFNVSMKFLGLDLPSDEWMDRRMELFRHFTVPSVAAQTQPDFEWVIYCATATRVDDLEAIQRCDPRIRIVLLGPTEAASARAREVASVVGGNMTVERFIRPETEMTIISRIDNDDAVSRDYLQTLRDLVPDVVALGHDALLHVPVRGYRYHLGRRQFFTAKHDQSPFQTIFERLGPDRSPVSPLRLNHMHAHEKLPTYFDERARLWLQVVHGENISNKLKYSDKAVDESEVTRQFALDLSPLQLTPSSAANPGT